MSLKTPLLFLIFNRPDTTVQVLEAIRRIKPQHLYIAQDGPREDHPGEAELVSNIRNEVLSSIDWDCNVQTLFREKNLGCKLAVSSAITWFFKNEEMGIILEDDCIPSQSFFLFCEKMLIKYKDDTRIWLISGHNPISSNHSGDSYFFSHYPVVWGWASWKRCWDKYDSNHICDSQLKIIIDDFFSNRIFSKIWIETLIKVKEGIINTWDFDLVLTIIINNGMIIKPHKNLVINIGFGETATHTKSANSTLKALPLQDIDVENLKDPVYIYRDLYEDLLYSEYRSKVNIITKCQCFIEIFKNKCQIFEKN